MRSVEDNIKKEALPYNSTKENVKKLIDAVKLKEGVEDSIKSYFGKGKYYDTKRTLQTFDVISEDMKLTEKGRIIAYSSDEVVESEWFKILMSFAPYEEFIQFHRINNKDGNNSIDLDEIKKFWGLRNYGSSDNNRNEALTTFAYFIVMAGIGEFIIGRKKSPSRVVINIRKLEEKLSLTSNEKNILEEKQNNEIVAKKSFKEDESEIEQNVTSDADLKNEFYTISIPIDSGVSAKIIIPKDTSKEDAELIKDMIDVVFKKKFGI